MSSYKSQMRNEKKCIFCGEQFTGQRKSFEHIIPQWLVAEADLSKRDMDVRLPGQERKISMARVGIKVCATCNQDGSNLEGRAKDAYIKLARGDELIDYDVRSLLDWLDKIRLGLWLWLVEQTRDTAQVQPKFRINQRIGAKDRFLFARRYEAGPPMKGLHFAGFAPFFIGLPGSFGMLINNIYLGSASGDFLVLRHIRDVEAPLTYGPDDLDERELLTDRPAGQRIRLIGGPSVFAQCIMPTESFATVSVPVWGPSAVHEGWSESHIMRLDSELRECAIAPSSVPLASSGIGANLKLMDLNVWAIAEFLVRDWAGGDGKK